MDDSIRSLTTESLLEVLLFHAGNDLLNILGYGELAKEKMDSSHPAFSALTEALQAAGKDESRILAGQRGVAAPEKRK